MASANVLLMALIHELRVSIPALRHQFCVGLLAGVATPTIPLRIVFFNVEVCNSGLADTSSNLQRIVYTDPYSLKNYWPGASAGRVYMDETVSTIINLRVPCSVSPISECNVWKWYNYARDNPSVMGGRAFSSFQFQVSVWLLPSRPTDS